MSTAARVFAAGPLVSPAAQHLDHRLASNGDRVVRELLVRAVVEHHLSRPFAEDPDRGDVLAVALSELCCLPCRAAALGIVDCLSSGGEGFLLVLDDVVFVARELGDDEEAARLASALAPGWAGSLSELVEASRVLQNS